MALIHPESAPRASIVLSAPPPPKESHERPGTYITPRGPNLPFWWPRAAIIQGPSPYNSIINAKFKFAFQK